jgi:RNA polymerase sigma-70 factor, ECF subfamily
MSFTEVTELENPDFALCANPLSTHEETLTVAIANHQHKLYRIAFRMLRNAQDAQDALQDALLLAFRNLSQFKGQAQMSTWLTTIVMNSARLSIRRRYSRGMQSFQPIDGEKSPDPEASFVDSRPDPEEMYGEAELQRRIHSTSERLSPKVRRAFQLVVLHGLSMREAAETIGVSVGTIKARVFHGRRQVLRMMRASTFRRTPRQRGQGAFNVQREAASAAV